MFVILPNINCPWVSILLCLNQKVCEKFQFNQMYHFAALLALDCHSFITRRPNTDPTSFILLLPFDFFFVIWHVVFYSKSWHKDKFAACVWPVCFEHRIEKRLSGLFSLLSCYCGLPGELVSFPPHAHTCSSSLAVRHQSHKDMV